MVSSGSRIPWRKEPDIGLNLYLIPSCREMVSSGFRILGRKEPAYRIQSIPYSILWRDGIFWLWIPWRKEFDIGLNL